MDATKCGKVGYCDISERLEINGCTPAKKCPNVRCRQELNKPQLLQHEHVSKENVPENPFCDPQFCKPRRPLAPDRVYHFNVIYNQACCPISRTKDTNLALRVTAALVERLESRGYVNNYFYDRDHRPNNSLTTELERVLAGSSVTILLLTPGFVHRGLDRYLNMSTFSRLLAHPRPNWQLLTLCVGVSKEDLTEQLSSGYVFYFHKDWEIDIPTWTRFDNAIGNTISTSTSNDLWPEDERENKHYEARRIYSSAKSDGDTSQEQCKFVQVKKTNNIRAGNTADIINALSFDDSSNRPDDCLTRDNRCHLYKEASESLNGDHKSKRTWSFYGSTETKLQNSALKYSARTFDVSNYVNTNSGLLHRKQIGILDFQQTESLKTHSFSSPSIEDRHVFDNKMLYSCKNDQGQYSTSDSQINTLSTKTMHCNEHMSTEIYTSAVHIPALRSGQAHLHKRISCSLSELQTLGNSYKNNKQTYGRCTEEHDTPSTAGLKRAWVSINPHQKWTQNVISDTWLHQENENLISHSTNDHFKSEYYNDWRSVSENNFGTSSERHRKYPFDNDQEKWKWDREYKESLSADVLDDFTLQFNDNWTKKSARLGSNSRGEGVSENFDKWSLKHLLEEISQKYDKEILNKNDTRTVDSDNEIYDDLARRTAANLRQRKTDKNNCDEWKQDKLDWWTSDTWISDTRSLLNQKWTVDTPSIGAPDNFNGKIFVHLSEGMADSEQNEQNDVNINSSSWNETKDTWTSLAENNANNVADPTLESSDTTHAPEYSAKLTHRSLGCENIAKKTGTLALGDANNILVSDSRHKLITDILSTTDKLDKGITKNLQEAESSRASCYAKDSSNKNVSVLTTSEREPESLSEPCFQNDMTVETSPANTVVVLSDNQDGLHQALKINSSYDSPVKFFDWSASAVPANSEDVSHQDSRDTLEETLIQKDQSNYTTTSEAGELLVLPDKIHSTNSRDLTKALQHSQENIDLTYCSDQLYESNTVRLEDYLDNTDCYISFQKSSNTCCNAPNIPVTNNITTNTESFREVNSIRTLHTNYLAAASLAVHDTDSFMTYAVKSTDSSEISRQDQVDAAVQIMKVQHEVSFLTSTNIEINGKNNINILEVLPTVSGKHDDSLFTNKEEISTSVSERTPDATVQTSVSECTPDVNVQVSVSEGTPDVNVQASVSECTSDVNVQASVSECTSDVNVQAAVSECTPDVNVQAVVSECTPDVNVQASVSECTPDITVQASVSECTPNVNVQVTVSECTPDVNVQASVSECTPDVNVQASVSECTPDVNGQLSVSECTPDVNVQASVSECTPDVNVQVSVSECTPDVNGQLSVSECTPDVNVQASVSECTPDVNVQVSVSECTPDVNVQASVSECTHDNILQTPVSKCTHDKILQTPVSECIQDDTVKRLVLENVNNNTNLTSYSEFIQADTALSNNIFECVPNNTALPECTLDNIVLTPNIECAKDNINLNPVFDSIHDKINMTSVPECANKQSNLSLNVGNLLPKTTNINCHSRNEESEMYDTKFTSQTRSQELDIDSSIVVESKETDDNILSVDSDEFVTVTTNRNESLCKTTYNNNKSPTDHRADRKGICANHGLEEMSVDSLFLEADTCDTELCDNVFVNDYKAATEGVIIQNEEKKVHADSDFKTAADKSHSALQEDEDNLHFDWRSRQSFQERECSNLSAYGKLHVSKDGDGAYSGEEQDSGYFGDKKHNLTQMGENVELLVNKKCLQDTQQHNPDTENLREEQTVSDETDSTLMVAWNNGGNEDALLSFVQSENSLKIRKGIEFGDRTEQAESCHLSRLRLSYELSDNEADDRYLATGGDPCSEEEGRLSNTHSFKQHVNRFMFPTIPQNESASHELEQIVVFEFSDNDVDYAGKEEDIPTEVFQDTGTQQTQYQFITSISRENSFHFPVQAVTEVSSEDIKSTPSEDATEMRESMIKSEISVTLPRSKIKVEHAELLSKPAEPVELITDRVRNLTDKTDIAEVESTIFNPSAQLPAHNEARGLDNTAMNISTYNVTHKKDTGRTTVNEKFEIATGSENMLLRLTESMIFVSEINNPANETSGDTREAAVQWVATIHEINYTQADNNNVDISGATLYHAMSTQTEATAETLYQGIKTQTDATAETLHQEMTTQTEAIAKTLHQTITTQTDVTYSPLFHITPLQTEDTDSELHQNITLKSKSTYSALQHSMALQTDDTDNALYHIMASHSGEVDDTVYRIMTSQTEVTHQALHQAAAIQTDATEATLYQVTASQTEAKDVALKQMSTETTYQVLHHAVATQTEVTDSTLLGTEPSSVVVTNASEKADWMLPMIKGVCHVMSTPEMPYLG